MSSCPSPTWSAASLFGSETNGLAVIERKRKGQFFTDPRVANLLAELAHAANSSAICDPMAGSAVMLTAVLQRGANPSTIHGVEIDPIAHGLAEHSLGEAAGQTDGVLALVLGDAFSSASWSALGEPDYDLVITNPPFVRYQTGGSGSEHMPSAEQVRSGLLNVIETRPRLSASDKVVLSELSRAYSGLSDLVIPSFLLCTAITRIGGRLAIVLPSTALTRNYASILWFALAKWFELEFVIEDADRAWFPDAQVKTVLVVARRIAARGSTLTPDPTNGHLVVRLRRAHADDRSIVGAAFRSESDPDGRFGAMARQALRDCSAMPIDSFATEWVDGTHSARRLRSAGRGHAWLRAVEPTISANPSATGAPNELAGVLSAVGGAGSACYSTAHDLGWQVGQGLRTGANLFFYVESLEESGGKSRIRTAAALGTSEIWIPNEFLLPALRRQSELPSRASVRDSDLQGRLLWLNNCALPEDLSSIPIDESAVPETWPAVLPAIIASYVRAAQSTAYGKNPEARPIAQLSAVSPNVRPWREAAPDVPPRFWYNLPPLTNRHTPTLAVPRVVGQEPRTYLIASSGVVVDANFSTLWPEAPTAASRFAMLALMNSTWSKAVMETGGTIMGGGALKLEATYLRRVAWPVDTDVLEAAERAGRAIAASSTWPTTMHDFDLQLAAAAVGSRLAPSLLRALEQSLAERRSERLGSESQG